MSTHMSTHMPTHVCTYVFPHIYTCRYTCLSMHMSIHMPTARHGYTHVLHARLYTCLYTCPCACLYACPYTHVHTHMSIQISTQYPLHMSLTHVRACPHMRLRTCAPVCGTPTDANARAHARHTQITTCPCPCAAPTPITHTRVHHHLCVHVHRVRVCTRAACRGRAVQAGGARPCDAVRTSTHQERDSATSQDIDASEPSVFAGTTERATARSLPPPDTAGPAQNDGKLALFTSFVRGGLSLLTRIAKPQPCEPFWFLFYFFEFTPKTVGISIERQVT